MANYVEQAVLTLTDRTTKPASQINKELDKLTKTVNNLAKATANLKFSPISAATINSYRRLNNEAKTLASTLGKVAASSKNNNFGGPTTAQASKTQAAAKALQALATAQRNMPKGAFRINVPLIAQNRIDRINQLAAAVRNYTRAMGAVPHNQLINPRVRGSGMNGGGGNNGGNFFMGGGVGGGRWTLTDTMIHGFALELQNAVRRAVIQGIKEGYRDRDLADTRLSDLNLNPQQRARANDFGRDLVQQFPVLNKGEAIQLYSETLPVAKGNEEGAKLLTVELARYVRTMVTRGENKENAIESANSIAKAGEQAGILMDDNGNFDIEGAKKFFETVNKGFLLLGREGNARFVQDLMRNLQGAKYAINDEGIITAMLLGEDMGASRTGTGINQAIRQLAGERIQKKQLNRLIEMGLLDPSAVPAGMVGDKTIMELVGGSATDEEGLRTNFFKWIANTLIPKMEEQGFNPNNPVHAAKFAGAISSDRTSVNMIAAAIVRAQDIKKSLEYGETLDTSNRKLDDTASRSGILAMQEFTSQTETLLGSIANSLERTFIPALRSAASVMQSMSEYFEGKTFSNSELAMGAVATGLGAYGLFRGAGMGARSMLGGALSMSASTVYINAGSVIGGGIGGAAATGAGATAAAAGATAANAAKAGWMSTIMRLIPVIVAANYAASTYDDVKDTKEKQGVGSYGADELLVSTLSSIQKWFTEEKPKREEDAIVQQLAEVTNKIAMAKEREAFPGANEMMIVALEREQRLLSEELLQASVRMDNTFLQGAAILDGNASTMREVFATGATNLGTVGPTIDAAAANFGPTAGAGLLGVASQFGTTAAQTFLAGANGLSVDVNVNAQGGPDTGRTPPLN